MFGTNPILKPDFTVRHSLPVHETFATIQGEGPFAGMPAWFIRLSGCSLACWFCDTDFSRENWRPELELLAEAKNWRGSEGDRNLIVITGGEPLARNITNLLWHLTHADFHVQIETAGIHPILHEKCYTPLFAIENIGPYPRHVSIVCSPKTPKIDKSLPGIIAAYKYIIGDDDELDPDDSLPLRSTQFKNQPAKLYRPVHRFMMRDNHLQKLFSRPIYVQPRDDGDYDKNHANTIKAAMIAQQHGYRLSLQQHKLLNLP